MLGKHGVVSRLTSLFSLVLFLCLTMHEGQAADWPEIHGPQRNGHADGERLASDWTKPPVLEWSANVGEGYAGVAVADAKVYVFHRDGKTETLDCLDCVDGTKTWSVQWPAGYRGGSDSDTGPRCVPLVRDGRVFLWSAAGDLHCVDTKGTKLWSRDLAKDFNARDGYFGFGSTPLVVGKQVMVNVGGKKGAAVVSMQVETGKDVWRQGNDASSYAAPIEWTVDGEKYAVFFTRLNLLGLRPADGTVAFQMPFGATGPTVNAAAPLVVSNSRLFVTASYRIGAKLVSIEGLGNGDKAKPLSPKVIWESDNSLSSQYPTPVYDDGYLYGVHGREDGPPAALRCVDATTGKVKWSKAGVGMAHLILADDKFLMLTTEGELVLFAKSSAAYRELGRLRVSNATTRALPALANGQMFVRSTDGKLSAWRLPAPQ